MSGQNSTMYDAMLEALVAAPPEGPLCENAHEAFLSMYNHMFDEVLKNIKYDGNAGLNAYKAYLLKNNCDDCCSAMEAFISEAAPDEKDTLITNLRKVF